MTKRKVFGVCRICGIEKQLTREHYIPQAAGGGAKVKLYNGDELFKTLNKDEDNKPKGRIQQSGLSEYTLCKDCNDLSGYLYDKEFARFYNGVHSVILNQLKLDDDQDLHEYLEGKVAEFEVEVKPLNIAKRILVSFASIEHPGLTDREPEIRKAILDKDYNPNTKNFSIYLSLHVGNSAFYGTVAALVVDKLGNHFIQAYAGIESNLIAFYYSGSDETKVRGLEDCVDITSWLTDYAYDEVDKLTFSLKFNGSKMVRFPLPPE